MVANKDRLLSSAILLAAFSGTAAFAQSQGIQFSGRSLAALPPVTGHPFSAQKEVVSDSNGGPIPHPELHAALLSSSRSYNMYRDSQGRSVTAPARASGGYDPNLTELDDPIAGYWYWYILDASTRIAHRSKMPVATPRPKPAISPASQPLGSQYILGVQTDGWKTFSGGSMLERWYCSDIQLVMIQRIVVSGGTGTEQITSLQLGNPPAELFQIPGDYTVLDESGPFVLK